MKSKSVLISGIGIAGPALAYWLLRFGFRPTLVERAPSLRSGGYVIDFWGAGLDLIERMGLLEETLAAGYRLKEVRLVNRHGRRVSGFDAAVFARATSGRYTSLPRSDLSAILYRSVADRVETVFGDTITELQGDSRGVEASFERGASRRFDLVVGADGLHSVVRKLAFGPEARFERFLGYRVAAFTTSGYRPRDEDAYVLFSVPGVQVGRFSMRGDRTMVLIVTAEDTPVLSESDEDRKEYLRHRLAHAGWECPHIVAALERSQDLYFDRVSQIRMDRWTRGRVALVGDAAHCVSLLAGQGAALALIGAYTLAVELARSASHIEAFDAYERLLQPFVREKQETAIRFAVSFAPRTALGIFLRSLLMKTFVIPGVARLAIGSSLEDRITLPPEPAPGGGETKTR